MTDHARQYIIELFKIVGTNSLLIIAPTGQLRRLYCPFKVICIVDVSALRKGQECSVTAVKMTLAFEDVFIIEGRAYHVWCFSIIG
jgi:hypothetical protein